MEEMGSFWNYQEGVDEMRLKVLSTTFEFEQFKAETMEELRKRNEYVFQLTQILKDVSQERDEARNQLQKLLNKVTLPSSASLSEFISNFPLYQNESPVPLKPTKACNSSIDSSEAAVNYNSHDSSPIDSFFDPVSSPDMSNNNNVGYLPHQPMLFQDSNLNSSMEEPEIDQATLMIDNIIEGKPLPQKGKLLQAVLDAPQLLHSLLLAGPLPKWRNPPRLQMIQIPSFSMQKDVEVEQQKPVNNLNFVGYSGANLDNFLALSKRQRLQ